MKAIIWKEWRENLWPTLFAIVAASLICAYMLSQALTSSQSWERIWSQGVMQPFTILAPILGAGIGFTQISPELKRDQWAFLIHRPAAIGTIFWGKVIAGLTLYLLTMLPPLLGLFLWLSRPGHTPGPFIPQMFLAPVADILSGALFYFAAILATLRLSKSRLSYFRITAFVFALACSSLSANVPEFWQSLIIIALGCCIVGSAAWGNFISLENYEKQPIKARAGLIITLYIGIAAAIITGMVLVAAFFTFSSQNYSSTQYRVDKTGRILKVTQSQRNITVRDLNGKILQSPNGKEWDWSNFLNEINFYLKEQPRTFGYRKTERYAMRVNVPYQARNSDAYYVHDRHWFEFYDETDHRRLGFLGPNGFSEAPSQRFSGTLQSVDSYPGNQIYQFSNAVYWIDFAHRRISRLYQTPTTGENFASTDLAAGNYLGNNTSWGAVVVAQRKIQFYSKQGRLRFSMPLEFSPDEYSSLSIAPVSNEKLILQQTGYRMVDDKAIIFPIQVREISGSGKVLKRYQLPPITNEQNFEQPSLYPLAVLVPPGTMALMTTYAALGAAAGNETATSLWNYIKQEARSWLIFTAITMVVGVLCAILAWRFGLRHGVNRKTRWLWAMSVFWTGFFGLITLLVLREWPPRIVCETCGKKRSVAQETCAHCHAAWPPPALDGTEIFV